MADFKSIDDIERDNAEKERKERRENIAEDINQVLERVKLRGNNKKKKRKWWVRLLLFLLGLGLFIMIINFVLGNIWLLRFLVNSLFKLKL